MMQYLYDSFYFNCKPWYSGLIFDCYCSIYTSSPGILVLITPLADIPFWSEVVREMGENAEDSKRIGSAMSIHMALINQEAANHKTNEEPKIRRSSSRRQRKANKIKLPKLPAASHQTVFRRSQLVNSCIDGRIDIPVQKEGLKLHHCSDHLLEESIKDSSLKQDLKV